jgi:putative ABC transport system ATP-binding protein
MSCLMQQECATQVIDMQSVERHFACGGSVVRALRGINLSVPTGEYVAIVGPSGSGKTTLMNILGCLDTPTGGSYCLDGAPVSDLDDAALARVRGAKIGFVFQIFNLLARSTALANVMLPLIYAGIPRRCRAAVASEVLCRVGLADRLHHLPNQLSGGQRQRVAIARALVNKPALLLADEPTGALDQKTGQEILTLFEQLNDSGTTVVVITHDMEVARRARRRIHIVDGQIVSDER